MFIPVAGGVVCDTLGHLKELQFAGPRKCEAAEGHGALPGQGRDGVYQLPWCVHVLWTASSRLHRPTFADTGTFSCHVCLLYYIQLLCVGFFLIQE